MTTASSESLILFNRQLASMVALDLPLPESLRRAGADLHDATFAKTVAELAAEVERGSSFSEALEKHKGALGEVYPALVKAGEAGGGLGEVLRRAASYEEQMAALAAKVQASLVYPAILFAALGLLLVLFGTLIIPRMSMLLQVIVPSFAHAGMAMRLSTRALIATGAVLGHWLTYVLAAAAAAFAWRRRSGWLAWLEERQLRIPVWREFITLVLMARFCTTLGELLARGVGTVEGFALTQKTMGNRVFEEALAKAGASIEKGGKIASALGETGVFPASAIYLLGASEEKGDLVGCLAELGDYYHRAAERRGLMLAKLIEPLVIAVMGLLIAFVVAGFFWPLFSIPGLVDE